MIVYYSGNADSRSDPEVVLDPASLMLSYYGINGGEGSRQRTRFSRVREVKMKETPGQILSHFLDSGSFTLWTKAAKYAQENKKDTWSYYDTREFYDYLDEYATFVKENRAAIDLYANVDTIPNPELTWRNQQYLEKKGINPVPVVHYKTDLKWLGHYINKGYEVIALGGLVGSMTKSSCIQWLDRCFERVCDGPGKLPKVKIHGFGVTGHDLMIRYPWWSVDSTSWTKVGGYGNILMPWKRGGKFTFIKAPMVVSMSDDSSKIGDVDKHYKTMKGMEQKIVREWLEEIDIPLGETDSKGETIVQGVVNCHSKRRAANLYFFERMVASLPKWPWPFRRTKPKGLLF